MKIIWLTNIEVPFVSEKLRHAANIMGGWLDTTSRELAASNNMVFIYSGNSFSQDTLEQHKTYTYIEGMNIDYFASIIDKESPDIIHIWGTEFKHTYDMVLACEKCNYLDRTVISIQGSSYLIGRYHYISGLPNKIVKGKTLRDLLKGQSVNIEKKNFENRGIWECAAIKKVRNVIGRTEWDYAFVKLINPSVNYYKCNETLRSMFYKDYWSYEACTPHTLFLSQGQYPVKGLHWVLESVRLLVSEYNYNDIMLIIAGHNFSKSSRYKRTKYQEFILSKIAQYHLENNVKFVGLLSEKHMVDVLKKANIYINASSIENSSNSLGEAMLLGCPCVASNVGGTGSMMVHGKEGFLYPYNEPYMLAYYCNMIFESVDTAKYISKNARIKASHTHDVRKNLSDLNKIYLSLNNRQ